MSVQKGCCREKQKCHHISQNTLPFRDNVKFKTGDAAPAKEDGRGSGVSPGISGVWSNHDLGSDRQE